MSINIHNSELLKVNLASSTPSLKFILNDNAIVFFPIERQHRETKLPGLSYEDDYKGNAMAGTIGTGRVDIRYHKAFSDSHVLSLWLRLMDTPELKNIKMGAIYYQGRQIA